MRSPDTADPVAFVAPTLSSSDLVRHVLKEEADADARLRNDGYRDGYQQGLEQARREVDAAIADHRSSAERLARVADALSDAARDLHGRDAVVLHDVDSEIVDLAAQLAEQLVGRELEVTSHPVRDAMRRALRVMPERGTPIVRVHPGDEATAREAATADLVRWGNDVEIHADGRIEPGGCIVEVGACRIDAQLGPAIARMRADG